MFERKLFSLHSGFDELLPGCETDWKIGGTIVSFLNHAEHKLFNLAPEAVMCSAGNEEHCG